MIVYIIISFKNLYNIWIKILNIKENLYNMESKYYESKGDIVQLG